MGTHPSVCLAATTNSALDRSSAMRLGPSHERVYRVCHACMSRLRADPMPTEIGLLDKLTILTIEKNKFTGAVPHQLLCNAWRTNDSACSCPSCVHVCTYIACLFRPYSDRACAVAQHCISIPIKEQIERCDKTLSVVECSTVSNRSSCRPHPYRDSAAYNTRGA